MKYCLLLIVSFLMVSCGSRLLPAGTHAPTPIYNQAYQENYEVDKITDILKNAKNAYVLVDPFNADIANFIEQIKANGNEVGGYISIGTGENYREDFEELKPYLVTKPWDLWNKEYFVNSTTTGVVEVMKRRIDKVAEWGCDWVEFDNMDWIFDDAYRKEYGFKVTQEEGIAYYNTLCEYAHSKGLKCMAKNTVERAVNFDGVLYESFHDNKNWWDTSGTHQFLAQGKFVIINHYKETNCNRAYKKYKKIYGKRISFICESKKLKAYVHFNQ